MPLMTRIAGIPVILTKSYDGEDETTLHEHVSGDYTRLHVDVATIHVISEDMTRLEIWAFQNWMKEKFGINIEDVSIYETVDDIAAIFNQDLIRAANHEKLAWTYQHYFENRLLGQPRYGYSNRLETVRCSPQDIMSLLDHARAVGAIK